MKLAKLIFVPALVLAAAVLFPLRKAQASFAARLPERAIVAAPRPPARRRPSGPRLTLRREAASHQAPTVDKALAGAAGGQLSRPADDGNSRPGSHTAHPDSGLDHCDRMIDRVDYAFGPEPTGKVDPNTPALVHGRFDAEIPKPPPKHAAL